MHRQESIIFERIFGTLHYRWKLGAVRNEWMKKERLSRHPLSYIEGRSIFDLPFADIIIHTVDSHVQVMYIQEDDTVYGSRYQIGAVERFTVEGIQDPIRVSGFLQEVNAEYGKVERLLNKVGFDTADLTRTWHYIYPINEYYSLFNNERRLFFERSNIYYIKRPECVLASTCIEGKCWGKSYSSTYLEAGEEIFSVGIVKWVALTGYTLPKTQFIKTLTVGESGVLNAPVAMKQAVQPQRWILFVQAYQRHGERLIPLRTAALCLYKALI